MELRVRILILLAWAFFSGHVSNAQTIKKLSGTETRKHFDGRLGYDIEEVIRAEEDPEYAERHRILDSEVQSEKAAILEHKRLREEASARDEQSRLEFIKARDAFDYVGQWKAQRKAYIEHVKARRSQEREQESIRAQYVVARDDEIRKKAELRSQNIQRAIASQRKAP